MTPERWQEIQRLFHEVRTHPLGVRPAVLAELCSDPGMRQQVERLLAQPASQDGVLEELAGILASEAADAAVPSLVGQRLGVYEIEALVGRGGMGEVYRARDTRLGREVAIKVLPSALTGDPERLARFSREARAVAALNHPHICTLYDVGPTYIVLEYVNGQPLAGPLPADTALRYAGEILDALDAAHQRGIVHRDLKPANLLITPHGVKLLDFGLARVTASAATLVPAAPATRDGAVLGTPGYMAPEQWAGKPADVRSDVYAFGCVLYAMLTGKHAGPGRQPVTPRALEEVVQRCLEDDPDRRWQSAPDVRAALAGAVRSTSRRRRMHVAAVASFIVLAAAGLLWWQLQPPTPPLTNRDVLVLADFRNDTGETAFDVTLQQALAIHLEQSPFLKVMDEADVRRHLQLMGRSPDEAVTQDIARELCIRAGEKATIGGAVARLDDVYVVTLQALNCQTGETVAREQVQARGKDQVLTAVGNATKAMRAGLGESLSSIQKLDQPEFPATTASLEAFRAFALGQQQFRRGEWLAAVPFYDRAIELDPKFAVAYQWAAFSYGNAEEYGRALEYSKKAMALAPNASERERLLIESYYYYRMMRNFVRANQVLQVYAETYPRDAAPQIFLANTLAAMGELEKAVDYQAEAVRLSPRNVAALGNLIVNYLNLDRFDDARATGQKAIDQGLDTDAVRVNLAGVAFVQGDDVTAERQLSALDGKPTEWLALRLRAMRATVSGQRRKAQELYIRAANIAARSQQPEAEREMRQAADTDPYVDCMISAESARPCGDGAALKAAEAERLERPDDTILNAVRLPLARAGIELQRNRPDRVIELLKSTAPYERSYPEAVYLRGVAYLRLERGAEAAAEFQKILSHKGANWGTRYSLSMVGLARAAALTGDPATARQAYRDFLRLWANADGDVPVFRDAQREYATLND